jgi:chromosome segregation ATPase
MPMHGSLSNIVPYKQKTATTESSSIKQNVLLGDYEPENRTMDIDQEAITDWKQEAATYQTALEAALLYQQDLEETISSQAASLKHQQAIIEQQRQTIQDLQTHIQKLKEQHKADRQTITQKNKSITNSTNQMQEQREYIKKLEQAIKIQRKALQRAQEDSTQE